MTERGQRWLSLVKEVACIKRVFEEEELVAAFASFGRALRRQQKPFQGRVWFLLEHVRVVTSNSSKDAINSVVQVRKTVCFLVTIAPVDVDVSISFVQFHRRRGQEWRLRPDGPSATASWSKVRKSCSVCPSRN